MGYSIVDFAKSLRVERCKIRSTNLVFLCGGKTADSGAYKSARDYFYRHLKKSAPGIAERVRLAEDVNAWFRRSEFPDLLELENYLADLADITVLFVESAGSIAELGAFAASDALRPKTLAVLNDTYDVDRSFIADGPVQKIKNEDPRLVHVYGWDPDPDQLNSRATKREFSEMAKDLTEFLEVRDRSRAELQAFNKEKHGHVLLMVAGLIKIAGVATSTDIADCLGELGCARDQERLSRYFSLLESMSLIRKVLRSNQAFYVNTLRRHFVRYAYRPGVTLKDQKRISAGIRDSLDKMRRRVLAKFLRQPPRKHV